ncbi:MAG TPA: two-component regulator propeller domain-containing protein [Bacteroidia bacterium]
MYQWRSHLSYNRAYSVAEYNNRIYCVVTIPDPGNDMYYMPTHQGIFYYDKGDNSYGNLSTVEGLSDAEPLLIRTNAYNNTLFIAYQNCNIDLLKGESVINVSDLKRKQIVGEKKINSVTFSGKYAYVATSLGIVVVDTDNGEIKDSYIIGIGGTYLNVYECALTSKKILAATESGIYYALLNSPNLSNYQEWTKETSLPSGPFNSIVNFNGKIITNYSRFIQSGQATFLQDSLYSFNDTLWSHYAYKPHDPYSYTIRKIVADNQKKKIAFIDMHNIHVQDENGNSISRVWAYDASTNQSVFDLAFENSNEYWIADKQLGLIRYKADNSGSYPLLFQRYIPNSPNTFLMNDMKIVNNKLVTAPIFLGDKTGNSKAYLGDGLYVFKNEEWKHVHKVTNPFFFDVSSVTIDPNDENHYFAGCYGRGVIEFKDDDVVALYHNQNSPLPLADGMPAGSLDTRVTDVSFDSDGNLWAACSYSKNHINARDVNGTWHSLAFSKSFEVEQLLVDKNNQVWNSTLAPSVGLVVYKNDGSFSAPSTANSYTVNGGDGDGQISGLILCMAEDKEGDIWVGTSKGIFVLYEPESVITNGVTAQRIYVDEEGVTKILLETEDITCIAVDGANNKWIGTKKSGVFCVSPDGQKELYHFSTVNSPLFADNILRIVVNPYNGEVFISTDKGMLSFQNSVTEGFEKFSDVYAYPNPVKPEYTGPIMIKGLVSGSNMKIMDVSGNFVYEATVEGGQAVWNAKGFNGKRVASGVYLVMCATTDGSQKVVAKILVVN